MPAPASRTVGKASEKASEKASDKASERDKPNMVAPVKAPGIPNRVEETAAPAVVATSDDHHSVPEMSEPVISQPVVKDAKYYLERGNLAYRSGDLPLALTDFDLAINLDPNSSDAYINRAIVFRKLGDLKRALADVVRARRIDEGKAR